MEIKRIFAGFCCVLLLLAPTGECMAGNDNPFGVFKDIENPLKKFPNIFKKTATENSDRTYSDTDCIPAGHGGSVGIWDQAKSMLLNVAVDQFMGKIMGVEDVFLIQEEITDTCMADKYLAYVDKKSQLLADASIHLLDAMADSFKNQADRKALEAARDAVSQQLEDGDKTDAVVSVGEGFSVYNEKLKGCKAVDQKAMAIVWVDSKNLSVRNVEILSLAKHIGTFTEENPAWAFKNFDRLKPFLVYAKGLAGQTRALAQTPLLVAAHFDAHDADLLAEAKKNNNKAIEAKLADEKGLSDDADETLGLLIFRFILVGWS